MRLQVLLCDNFNIDLTSFGQHFGQCFDQSDGINLVWIFMFIQCRLINIRIVQFLLLNIALQKYLLSIQSIIFFYLNEMSKYFQFLILGYLILDYIHNSSQKFFIQLKFQQNFCLLLPYLLPVIKNMQKPYIQSRATKRQQLYKGQQYKNASNPEISPWRKNVQNDINNLNNVVGSITEKIEIIDQNFDSIDTSSIINSKYLQENKESNQQQILIKVIKRLCMLIKRFTQNINSLAILLGLGQNQNNSMPQDKNRILTSFIYHKISLFDQITLKIKEKFLQPLQSQIIDAYDSSDDDKKKNLLQKLQLMNPESHRILFNHIQREQAIKKNLKETKQQSPVQQALARLLINDLQLERFMRNQCQQSRRQNQEFKNAYWRQTEFNLLFDRKQWKEIFHYLKAAISAMMLTVNNRQILSKKLVEKTNQKAKLETKNEQFSQSILKLKLEINKQRQDLSNKLNQYKQQINKLKASNSNIDALKTIIQNLQTQKRYLIQKNQALTAHIDQQNVKQAKNQQQFTKLVNENNKNLSDYGNLLLQEQNKNTQIKKLTENLKVEISLRQIATLQFNIKEKQLVQKIHRLEKANQQIQRQKEQSLQQANILRSLKQRLQYEFLKGSFLVEKLEDQKFLSTEICALVCKKPQKAKLLFRMDPFNKNNPHLYFDKKQNILILIKTAHQIIGAFVTSAFDRTKQYQVDQNGKAIIFCLNEKYVYQKLPGKGTIKYESEFLNIGNYDIRIDFGKKALCSNLGKNSSHFDSKGCESVILIDKKGYREIESYQIFEVEFSQQSLEKKQVKEIKNPVNSLELIKQSKVQIELTWSVDSENNGLQISQ